jgi:Tfp pilus assembly protein PilN
MHVNLFLPTERRIPTQVRARIMVPVTAVLFAVAVLVGLLLAGNNRASVEARRDEAVVERDNLKVRHTAYLELKKEAEIVKSDLTKMEKYKNSRIDWEPVLFALPRIIPESVQLIELVVDYPHRETNGVEIGRLRIGGVTTDNDAAQRIVAQLAKEPFNAIFTNAVIGDYKIELAEDGSSGERYLFEVKGQTQPRRFK